MNVPKLRFKEFTDEWSTKRICDVATVTGGGTPSTDNSKYWNGDIQWFTPSEIGKTKYISNSSRTITKDGLKNSSAKLLPIGTILLSSRATIGEASILTNVASTNQGFQSLIVDEKYNNEFIFYLKNKFQKEMLIKAFGSTFLEISKSNIENIKIILPTLNEQNKIANFLSLLDKKIELQTKKIEDLKLYKLCLKNRVFNESGMLRYKLNNLCCCKASNINLLDIEFDNGKFPIYGATGEIKKISTFQFSDNYIAIVKDGASVGKTIICDGNSSIIATMSAIIPNKIPIYYFNELIENINFSKYIVGSGIPHIYFKDYSTETVKIHNRPRMKLIDSIFYDLSRKITYEEDKLKKLFQLKKGLMQNMFV